MIITYQFRVKDKHAKRLSRMARATNFVWNFCNETQMHALRWGKRWPSGYDLINLTAGSSKAGLDLSAESIGRVCIEYANKRRQFRRPFLRWRGKKSLGWVPLNGGTVRFKNGKFIFRGHGYSVWMSRGLPDNAVFGCGSFSADAAGRWYLNLPVEVAESQEAKSRDLGIDLGLKELATLSDGQKIEARRFYRAEETALATAQRARKKARVRAIHRKIANRRKDFLHKTSTRIAKENGLIVIGNVSPSQLAKTSMAKSVLDAGWADFKRMLSYKSIRNGGIFLEVDEANTTRICSECGSIAGPKGRAGLNERTWRCDCGAVHDRDVNSALNILRLGHQALAEGASKSRGDVNSEKKYAALKPKEGGQ